MLLPAFRHSVDGLAAGFEARCFEPPLFLILEVTLVMDAPTPTLKSFAIEEMPHHLHEFVGRQIKLTLYIFKRGAIFPPHANQSVLIVSRKSIDFFF